MPICYSESKDKLVVYSMQQYIKEILNPTHNYILDVCLFQGPKSVCNNIVSSVVFSILNKLSSSKGLAVCDESAFIDMVSNIQVKHHFFPIKQTGRTYEFPNHATFSHILPKEAKRGDGYESKECYIEVFPNVDKLSETEFFHALRFCHQKQFGNWGQLSYRVLALTSAKILPEWIYQHFMSDQSPNYRTVMYSNIEYFDMPESIVSEVDKVEPFDLDAAAKLQNPHEDDPSRKGYFSIRDYYDNPATKKRSYSKQKSTKRKTVIKIGNHTDLSDI